MTKIIIVGLAGKKRSGKDTAANLIATDKTYILPLAGAIKAKVASATGVPLATLEQDKLNPDSQARLLLQSYGVYMREKHGPAYWIQQHYYKTLYPDVVSKLELTSPDPMVYAIPDIRFANELEYLTQLADALERDVPRVTVTTYSVLVERPEPNPGAADTHISERSLPPSTKFDYIFDNSADLATYERNVLNWLNVLGG